MDTGALELILTHGDARSLLAAANARMRQLLRYCQQQQTLGSVHAATSAAFGPGAPVGVWLGDLHDDLKVLHTAIHDLKDADEYRALTGPRDQVEKGVRELLEEYEALKAKLADAIQGNTELREKVSAVESKTLAAYNEKKIKDGIRRQLEALATNGVGDEIRKELAEQRIEIRGLTQRMAVVEDRVSDLEGWRVRQGTALCLGDLAHALRHFIARCLFGSPQHAVTLGLTSVPVFLTQLTRELGASGPDGNARYRAWWDERRRTLRDIDPREHADAARDYRAAFDMLQEPPSRGAPDERPPLEWNRFAVFVRDHAAVLAAMHQWWDHRNNAAHTLFREMNRATLAEVLDPARNRRAFTHLYDTAAAPLAFREALAPPDAAAVAAGLSLLDTLNGPSGSRDYVSHPLTWAVSDLKDMPGDAATRVKPLPPDPAGYADASKRARRF